MGPRKLYIGCSSSIQVRHEYGGDVEHKQSALDAYMPLCFIYFPLEIYGANYLSISRGGRYNIVKLKVKLNTDVNNAKAKKTLKMDFAKVP